MFLSKTVDSRIIRKWELAGHSVGLKIMRKTKHLAMLPTTTVFTMIIGEELPDVDALPQMGLLNFYTKYKKHFEQRRIKTRRNKIEEFIHRLDLPISAMQ